MTRASKGCGGLGAAAAPQAGAPAARDLLFGPPSAAAGGRAAGRRDAANKVRQGPEAGSTLHRPPSRPGDPARPGGARQGVATCRRTGGYPPFLTRPLPPSPQPIFFSLLSGHALPARTSHLSLPRLAGSACRLGSWRPLCSVFLSFFVTPLRSSPPGLSLPLTVWGLARLGPCWVLPSHSFCFVPPNPSLPSESSNLGGFAAGCRVRSTLVSSSKLLTALSVFHL